ncbi:hypothetical protein EPI10_025186 [Gossypium australe]|uniref:Uncharacterized protein n=1 Tax=Gossypium australe TaxID=47621 RepID=A0A5B6W185_9ROSI|nr:hypothetical protein EPI10_025186 [Gossypium australe]
MKMWAVTYSVCNLISWLIQYFKRVGIFVPNIVLSLFWCLKAKASLCHCVYSPFQNYGCFFSILYSG